MRNDKISEKEIIQFRIIRKSLIFLIYNKDITWDSLKIVLFKLQIVFYKIKLKNLVTKIKIIKKKG
jgi:hypothetical protein